MKNMNKLTYAEVSVPLRGGGCFSDNPNILEQ